jgi:hypothetical protein
MRLGNPRWNLATKERLFTSGSPNRRSQRNAYPVQPLDTSANWFTGLAPISGTTGTEISPKHGSDEIEMQRHVSQGGNGLVPGFHALRHYDDRAREAVA